MRFDNENQNIAWCPGCGNFAILNALKQALEETDYANTQTVIVSGIGQAAKTPQYLKANCFNGLHGRTLPPATGIKASNKDLKVIATSGDGDIYGEGGNHFIHAIRRNPDITLLVFNNMVYGLTKGQASPTSKSDLINSAQPHGSASEPFNPIAVAIAQDISFVARTFCQNVEFTKNIILEALNHKGFSLVDILTPCVTFNKINTYKWFADNTYYLQDHDTSDRIKAFEAAINTEKMALGVFFKQDKVTFEENEANKQKTPLYKNQVNFEKLRELIDRHI